MELVREFSFGIVGKVVLCIGIFILSSVVFRGYSPKDLRGRSACFET
jgi:hypothetical protein